MGHGFGRCIGAAILATLSVVFTVGFMCGVLFMLSVQP